MISYTHAAPKNAIKLHNNNCGLICSKNFYYLQLCAKNTRILGSFSHFRLGIFGNEGGIVVLYFHFCERTQKTCSLCVYMLHILNMWVTEKRKSEPALLCLSFFIFCFAFANQAACQSWIMLAGFCKSVKNWNCSWLWRHADFWR